jgi:hypothetical protein
MDRDFILNSLGSVPSFILNALAPDGYSYYICVKIKDADREIHRIRINNSSNWQHSYLSQFKNARRADATIDDKVKYRDRPCWHPDGTLYHMKREEDWLQDQETTINSVRRLCGDSLADKLDERLMTKIEHNSILEFFQYVGYNWKTKRWVN